MFFGGIISREQFGSSKFTANANKQKIEKL